MGVEYYFSYYILIYHSNINKFNWMLFHNAFSSPTT